MAIPCQALPLPCATRNQCSVRRRWRFSNLRCQASGRPPTTPSSSSTNTGPCSSEVGHQDSPVPATALGSSSASEEVQYKDSPTDIAFIGMCRKAYGRIAGWQSSRPWDDGPETFAGMVEVSRALMKGRTAEQQRNAVISGFPTVPAWFRRAFPYTKWGAELNARITPAFFTWLVGPMETTEVEINGVKQQSRVFIKRCRYLAESGCTAMCVNLCKAPTQSFFTEQLGMPVTMNPNFDDYSCEMIFGQVPLPLSEDPVSRQPCLAVCPTGIPAEPGSEKAAVGCHKMD